MLDFNDKDSNDIPKVRDLENQIVDSEETFRNQDVIIENQYVNLENLGTDLMKTIYDDDLKTNIYDQLLEFVNENYFSIIYLDQTNISRIKLNEVGYLIYQFLCVDCYNTLIPNYLSKIDAYNIKQFDLYFKTNLKNEVSSFKADFAKTINNIINKLLNLSNIDEKISKDKSYNDILKKYGFYLETINYGEFNNFLFNYFRPLLIKHESDLLWRIT